MLERMYSARLGVSETVARSQGDPRPDRRRSSSWFRDDTVPQWAEPRFQQPERGDERVGDQTEHGFWTTFSMSAGWRADRVFPLERFVVARPRCLRPQAEEAPTPPPEHPESQRARRRSRKSPCRQPDSVLVG
jgi:hypothetical protein